MCLTLYDCILFGANPISGYGSHQKSAMSSEGLQKKVDDQTAAFVHFMKD